MLTFNTKILSLSQKSEAEIRNLEVSGETFYLPRGGGNDGADNDKQGTDRRNSA